MASRRACARATAALLALAALLPAASAADPRRLVPVQSGKGVTKYVLDVTVGTVNTDCTQGREAYLINGMFQPIMEVHEGDKLEVTVNNKIPKSFPEPNDGALSIHWHGFQMRDNPWMDGTLFVAQCPIARGASFTYSFTVDEPPGTYFYHDHSQTKRADGLQGMLIVRPKGEPLGAAKNENVLFLQDWWHSTYGGMAMRLNRPFDPAKVTNTSGQWCWIGMPKSLLINGKGSFSDCEDVYARKVGKPLPNGNTTTAADLLTPNDCVAGSLGGPAAWPVCKPAQGECAREETEIEAGSTRKFRILNAAAQVYTTVCFMGHNVTIVAADARPIVPVTLSECVDVNSGQRLDVEVKGDAKPGAYWIAVTPQYRKGAPSAFGVLRYKGTPKGALPSGAVPQSKEMFDRKWSPTQYMTLFKAPKDAPAPPEKVDYRFVVQTTQPVMPNGYLRWAINNVAHAETPPCDALMSKLKENPKLLESVPKLTAATDDAPYWGKNALRGDDSFFRVMELNGPNAKTLIDAKVPKVGLHSLTVPPNKVVEIVLQNNRAGAYGGEYGTAGLTFNRTGREQHPFHLHGQHFHVVGMGFGPWSPEKVDGPDYNLKDAVRRDTATLMFAPTGDQPGWTALRFKTNNPGVWPLHCHLDPHHLMGHGLNLIVAPDQIPAPPASMPACPKTCPLSMAKFTLPLTKAAYGDNPLLAPLQSNNNRRLAGHARA